MMLLRNIKAHLIPSKRSTGKTRGKERRWRKRPGRMIRLTLLKHLCVLSEPRDRFRADYWSVPEFLTHPHPHPHPLHGWSDLKKSKIKINRIVFVSVFSSPHTSLIKTKGKCEDRLFRLSLYNTHRTSAYNLKLKHTDLIFIIKQVQSSRALHLFLSGLLWACYTAAAAEPFTAHKHTFTPERDQTENTECLLHTYYCMTSAAVMTTLITASV